MSSVSLLESAFDHCESTKSTNAICARYVKAFAERAPATNRRSQRGIKRENAVRRLLTDRGKNVDGLLGLLRAERRGELRSDAEGSCDPLLIYVKRH